MFFKHSQARHRKERAAAAPAGLDPLFTREELAERWRTTPVTISRKYKKLGLRPMRASGRLLFFGSNIAEVEQLSAAEGEAASAAEAVEAI